MSILLQFTTIDFPYSQKMKTFSQRRNGWEDVVYVFTRCVCVYNVYVCDTQVKSTFVYRTENGGGLEYDSKSRALSYVSYVSFDLNDKYIYSLFLEGERKSLLWSTTEV